MFKPNLSMDELVNGIAVTFEVVRDDPKYASLLCGAADPLRRWFDIKSASVNAGVMVDGAVVGLATFQPAAADSVDFHMIVDPRARGRWSTRCFWRDLTRFGLNMAPCVRSFALVDHEVARGLLAFAGFQCDGVMRHFHQVGEQIRHVAVYSLLEGEQAWK